MPVKPFDPYANDGLGLSTWLNAFINAYSSTNADDAAPTNAQMGGLWVDTTGVDITLKIFDGVTWVTVFTVDGTSGTIEFDGTTTGGGSGGTGGFTPYYAETDMDGTTDQFPLSATLEPIQSHFIKTSADFDLLSTAPFTNIPPAGSEIVLGVKAGETGSVTLLTSANIYLNGPATLRAGKTITLIVNSTTVFTEKCRN